MDKLVKSVKKKYNERRICVEQKQPWSRQSNRLVRLQLVNKKKVDGSSTSARRGEDKKITPLAYGDLFKAESGERPVRKVLVEGDAGIGKTTLTVSLSEEWASDKLFQEFELILLLPLRLEKVASAGSLHKLLEVFHSDEEIYKSVDSYLKKKEGENVLVIADGWDELSECQRNKSSLLYQFLFVDFPLMSVLVTSRPSTSAPLHNLACIDRFVEIKGFGEDNIKEYVQSEFATDQKKAQRLLEQLQYNPLIQSVCSVPLNCAIVCHLWHTLKEDLPSTMTQLYEKIILHFVCHNLRKLPAYGSTFSMASFNDLPEGLQKSWWLLCEFAFKALEKDQIVFSKKQLPEISKDGNEQVLCFGLLQSVETVLALTTEVSYNFLHLTFMEYLAALHLSRQPLDSSWLKLLRNNCGMVLRFFFGIRFCDTKIGADIGNFMQNIQYVERLSLFHCVFEAQNAIVNREVRFGGKLCQPHNPHDCAAILYVIGNMQECSDLKINFDYSGVRENQIKQLADVLASKDGKLQVKRLSLRGNKLTDKIVSYLFNRALAAFHSLTRLDLSGNRIGAESIKSIKTALAKSSPSGCTLSWLSLSYNPLEKCGLRALDNALHEGVLSNLNTLYLSGSLTSDADTNASRLTSFVEALSAHCPYMRKLDLSRNHLDVLRATALARSISRLQQPHSTSDGELISMVLTQTNLSDEGLRAFVDSLEGACYFEHLHLGDNDIHANGVSCLADAVHSGKIVLTSRLNLSENALGLEGALAIGRMLSSNHCKPYCLLLYRCKLTTGGSGLPNTVSLNRDSNISSEVIGRQLCQMPQNNAIVKLVLMGNSFTGNDIHILAAFMYLCPGLRFLFTDQCGITSDDLKQLFDTLPSLIPVMPFSNLEEWWLDDNQIDDGGVSALIDHLPPLLLSPNDIDIHLDGNPAITSYRETKERLKEKQGSHKELESDIDELFESDDSESESTSTSAGGHLSFAVFLSQFSRKSSNDDYIKGAEKPLSKPHPPQRPHLLTTSQSTEEASVGQEGLSVSGASESGGVTTDSRDEPAEQVQTTVSQTPLEQVLDSLSDGVSKHLGQIADEMSQWEGRIAEELGLKDAEVAVIKTAHPYRLDLQKRAALEKWKQKPGYDATYDNLICVFERAGYQGYAEVVRRVCGATPTNQALCVTTEQESTSVTDKSSTTTTAAGERSCDKSHDSSESDDESYAYATPSQAPVDKDRALSGVLCGHKRTSSDRVPFSQQTLPPSLPQPELKDLLLIKLVKWHNVGLKLGVKGYELNKIEQDHHCHDDQKREMFSKWLKTVNNPNYHDLIEALEAVGERKAAQQLRDKFLPTS